MLEKIYISVCEVDDGEEAIKQVKSRHEIGCMFKLIIMDVEIKLLLALLKLFKRISVS